MKWDKEIDKYNRLQELRNYYEERIAENMNYWEKGAYVQQLMKDYQRAVMDYNETVEFHEYIPKLSKFDTLVFKGKMTDVYTDDLDYYIMCDRY